MTILECFGGILERLGEIRIRKADMMIGCQESVRSDFVRPQRLLRTALDCELVCRQRLDSDLERLLLDKKTIRIIVCCVS